MRSNLHGNPQAYLKKLCSITIVSRKLVTVDLSRQGRNKYVRLRGKLNNLRMHPSQMEL